jgi:hypothetical protein
MEDAVILNLSRQVCHNKRLSASWASPINAFLNARRLY